MSRFLAHLKRSIPAPGEAFAGALLWAAAMSLSAVLVLVMREWGDNRHIGLIAAIYAIGGVLGWLVGLYFARVLSPGASPERRFAAAVFSLGIATIAATSGVFALQYREYYAQWHAPFPTITWVFQFIFTIASALYQFAVLGLRLFMPLGLVVLIGFGLAFALRER